jgi:hypothetical protein
MGSNSMIANSIENLNEFNPFVHESFTREIKWGEFERQARLI